MGRIGVWFVGSVVWKLDHDAYTRRRRHWRVPVETVSTLPHATSSCTLLPDSAHLPSSAMSSDPAFLDVEDDEQRQARIGSFTLLPSLLR